MKRTIRFSVLLAQLGFAVVILAAARAGVADDLLRPVRQIENDDGVIELTNAQHDDAVDIDRAPAPKAVTPRRALAPKQVKAGLRPAAAPRGRGEGSGAWWLLWVVAGVVGGAGALLWRRANRPPPWSVDHEPPERTSGPTAALSTLAPRERAVQGEPQWVSQLPHSRSARR